RLHEVFDGQRHRNLFRPLDDPAQVAVRRQLHDHVRVLALTVDVDERHDVWMGKPRRRPHDLSESPLDLAPLLLSEEVEQLANLLDRNRALEIDWARGKAGADAARADPFDLLVAAVEDLPAVAVALARDVSDDPVDSGGGAVFVVAGAA